MLEKKITDLDRHKWLYENADVVAKGWRFYNFWPSYFDGESVMVIIDAAIMRDRDESR